MSIGPRFTAKACVKRGNLSCFHSASLRMRKKTVAGSLVRRFTCKPIGESGNSPYTGHAKKESGLENCFLLNVISRASPSGLEYPGAMYKLTTREDAKRRG